MVHTKRGWWKLKINEIDKGFDTGLTDSDQEHIAKSIKEGMREGELIQE